MAKDTPETFHRRIEQIIADTTEYREQRRLNWEIRFNIDPEEEDQDGVTFPFDGAPQNKIPLVDGDIRESKAVLVQALTKGDIFIDPVEASDHATKDAAEDIWHHYQRKIPNKRKIERLTADRYEEKGAAVLGTFMKTELEGYKETINVTDLEPEIQLALGVPPELAIENFNPEDPALAQRIEAIQAQILDIDIANYLLETFNVPEEDALEIIGDLRAEGIAQFDATGPKDGSVKIVRKPYILNTNFFMAHPDLHVQDQPFVFTVDLIPQHQMESNIRTLGWSSKAVKMAIENNTDARFVLDVDLEDRDRLDEAGINPETRSFFDDEGNREGLLLPVINVYYRKMRDGVPVIRAMNYTPFSGMETPLKDQELSNKHGSYPFILFQKEVVSERADESRGQPQISGSMQECVKNQINVMDWTSILRAAPPIKHQIGKQPQGQFGPLEYLGYEFRADEFDLMEIPANNGDSSEVIGFLVDINEKYKGRRQREATMGRSKLQSGFREARTNDDITGTLTEYDVSNWLDDWTDLYRLEFANLQQFIPDSIQTRIHNDPNAPSITRHRREIQGEFDIVLEADPYVYDRVGQEKADTEVHEIITTFRPENVDIQEYVKIRLLKGNKSLARKVLQDPRVVTKRQYEAEMNFMNRALNGLFDPELEHAPQDVSPSFLLPLYEKLMQRPDIQQRMAQDEVFAETVTTRIKEIQHIAVQADNAQRGRRGA